MTVPVTATERDSVGLGKSCREMTLGKPSIPGPWPDSESYDGPGRPGLTVKVMTRTLRSFVLVDSECSKQTKAAGESFQSHVRVNFASFLT
jgi:hypothetical protein